MNKLFKLIKDTFNDDEVITFIQEETLNDLFHKQVKLQLDRQQLNMLSDLKLNKDK